MEPMSPVLILCQSGIGTEALPAGAGTNVPIPRGNAVLGNHSPINYVRSFTWTKNLQKHTPTAISVSVSALFAAVRPPSLVASHIHMAYPYASYIPVLVSPYMLS